MNRSLVCFTLALLSSTSAEEGGGSLSPDSRSANFKKALSEISLRTPGRSFVLDYGNMVKPARQLAEALGPESVAFLDGQLQKNGEEGLLAAFTLAAMPDEKTAVDSLSRAASAPERLVWKNAVAAIAYMPPEQIRSISESKLAKGKKGQQRISFIELLGIVGSSDSLTLLKQLQQHDSNQRIQIACKHAIDFLQQKQSLKSDRERTKWEQQGLLLWRVNNDVCLHHVERECDKAAAKRFLAGGEHAMLPLLLLRFNAGDQVATELIGLQKEVGAISVFKEQVSQPTQLGQLARRGLSALGTPEALKVLMSGFVAGQTHVNYDISRQLVTSGNEETSRFLRGLAEDPKYDEESQRVFRKAANDIDHRVK